MSLALFYIFCILVLFLYIILILYLNFHWNRLYIPDIDSKQNDLPFVSIIIIGRNEEQNIENCIRSIAANNFPKEKYEIIYIDDESEDNSEEILKSIKIENFNYFRFNDITNLPTTKNHKKEAIKAGIALAKGDIILQTDADTIIEENWIYLHAVQYIDNANTGLVTAPVLYIEDNNFLSKFQYYDLLTTMGITAAGISSNMFFMANGANMSYRKKTFLTTKFDSKYASGDDMFLIQETAIKNTDDVIFLKDKNAVLYTFPEKTLIDFIRQRLRWASKTKGYKDRNLQLIVSFVFIVNLIVLINFVLILFLNTSHLFFALILFLLKLLVDSYFIFNISRFFGKKIDCGYLLLSLLVYPVYMTFIGITGLFTTKYKWKGRMVR